MQLRTRPDHDRRGVLLAVAAFVLAGAALGFARWELEPRHHAGDTFWYARYALLLGGRSEAEATRGAAEFLAHEEDASPEGRIEMADSIDPRYPAIFASRPAYPLIVASLMVVLDLRTAMVVGTLAAGVAFAAAFGWFLRWVTSSTIAALVGVGLAFALPSGTWFAFMIADGWMLALWAASLAFATRYLLHGGSGWLAAGALTLVVLYATKAANGATLVATVMVLAAIMLAARAEVAGRAVHLAALFTVIGVGQLVAFALLGLPGLETTLQDLFTGHFTEPDVDNPLGRLIERNVAYLPGLVKRLVLETRTLYVLVPLLVPLLLVRRWWAAAWLLGGLASGLTVIIHPVVSEIPRLMAPVWISAALGGALAAAWLLELLRSGALLREPRATLRQ